MAQYEPGQRWISDSEAELGLGTVLMQDGRMLTVLYPATGETRQYALRNAPLTRVRFSPGDEITHLEGWKLTLQEVDDVDGLKAGVADVVVSRPVDLLRRRVHRVPLALGVTRRLVREAGAVRLALHLVRPHHCVLLVEVHPCFLCLCASESR